jgi:uncharacterized damage-inducible protein DinB
VDAATRLSAKELNQDFGTADGSVLNTLVHVFASERLWLARLEQATYPEYVTAADRHLEVLQNEWPRLHQRWKEWASQLTDEAMLLPLTYTDLKGNQYTQPLWQLVLHVVNHGTHHRGQVSGFLRSLRYTPPPIDLIFFYRGLMLN